MAAKKKQRSYSVDFKLKIFEEVEEKVLSKTEICKKYNIANSTLSTFLKNRKKIEQQNDGQRVQWWRRKEDQVCKFFWIWKRPVQMLSSKSSLH
jgi:transposase-like protein